MQGVLKTLLSLLALLFLGIGLLFMFYPTPMLELAGLEPARMANPELAWSTVRGDLGALFLLSGISLGLGIINGDRTWLIAATLVMAFIFIGRAVGLVVNGGHPQIYIYMAGEAFIVVLIWLYMRSVD